MNPVSLHFEDSGKWYCLPQWAEYFINLGKCIATAPASENRIVVAIAIPTRAFGAVFCSLGMVVSEAAEQNRPSEAAHFEKLFDLPAGTPVIFRQSPHRVQKGVLQDPEEYNGKLHVRVQVQDRDARIGGGLTYLIDESRALQVQPAKHSGKLPKKPGVENKQFANSFVERLLGEADPVQLGLRSKLVCAIVGKKNSLEHEIRQTPLAVHVNGDCRAEGRLQDVLRVDRFITDQQSYRSALVPVGSSPPSGDVASKIEKAVVFDGAAGFLKWGAMWPNQHQVIILDRTELYFDDAISAINSRFSQNRAETETLLPDSDVPPGGEVLAFREMIP